MIIEATRSYVAAVGSTGEIIDIFFGPQQHNEHCRGWRWHLYMADMGKREASMRAALKQMIAEHRAQENAQSLWEDA